MSVGLNGGGFQDQDDSDDGAVHQGMLLFQLAEVGDDDGGAPEVGENMIAGAEFASLRCRSKTATLSLTLGTKLSTIATTSY